MGRQPWTIYGVMWTSEAATPFLTTPQVATTLILFATIYGVIFMAGVIYIYRQFKEGPVSEQDLIRHGTNPKRPFSLSGSSPGVRPALEGAP